MDKEIVLAIISVIGGIGGTIRWLLGYYFKKMDKLEEYKDTHVNQSLAELKEVVHEHTKLMSVQGREMKELDKKLDISISRYSQYQDAQESVIESFRTFVDATNSRVLAVEGKVIELGKDVFMIKSKGSRS